MSKVITVPPLNSYQIQQITYKIISNFQPSVFKESPFNIDKFYTVGIPKITGITTGIEDLSRYGEGVLGVTDAGKKESLIDASLYESDSKSMIGRCNTTMCHESGHCYLHVGYATLFLSKQQNRPILFRNESDIPPWQNPEWQAWEFTRQLLMPKNIFLRLNSYISCFISNRMNLLGQE